EHDLAVRLTAGLKTDTQLIHRRIAHVRAVSVDVAAPMRSTDHKAALADGWEHGIAVAVVEEGGALACVPKERRRVGIRVGPTGRAPEHQHRSQQARVFAFHDDSSV